MLIPAITKKSEIQDAFKKYFYTDDMMYETGSPFDQWVPDISENPSGELFQYAVMSNDKLIGYLSYRIDFYSSCAYSFGLISFDRGNPIIGKDLFSEMEKLINEYHLHRIEWKMVGGNPVEKAYDRFCNKYNGTKHIFKDVFKDKQGKYHDSIIYEIVRQEDKIN